MKKILLLCLLAFNLQSQTLTILSLSSNEVCSGKNFTISFKYKGVYSSSNYYTFYYQSSNSTTWVIKVANCNAFYLMNKNLQGTDTIYSFVATTSVSIPYGAYKVGVTPDNGTSGKQINIIGCGPVGIIEYEPDVIKPIYYDIMGNIVDPKEGRMVKRIRDKVFIVIE